MELWALVLIKALGGHTQHTLCRKEQFQDMYQHVYFLAIAWDGVWLRISYLFNYQDGES